MRSMVDENVMAAISAAISLYLEDEALAAAGLPANAPDHWKQWSRRERVRGWSAWRYPNAARRGLTSWRDPSFVVR